MLATALVALVALVDEATPPLRLPPGTDTLKAIAEKNLYVRAETRKGESLSRSTGFPV
jgi:hypothetical protein